MGRLPISHKWKCPMCTNVTTQGQKAKSQHMLDVHGLKFGYQNVGKTGNKKSGWKKQSLARQKNLKERGAE